MGYVTTLPSSVVTVEADLLVLDLNENHVLNNFYGPSVEYTEITAVGSADTASNGASVTIQTANGPIVGTYVGPAVISTQNATAEAAGTGINLVLNDVNGHVVMGEDGNVYILSDTVLSDDSLGVTINFSILGTPYELIDVPISEANNAIIDVVDGLGQAAYQTAYDTTYATGVLLPAPLRVAAAEAAGIAARTPFSLISTALGGTADVIQGALDLAVINVAVGSGSLPVTPVCFAKGTMITTGRGEVAIEDLAIGDMVLTRDHGLQEIRWIGSTKLSAIDLMVRPELRPITIKANALGIGAPSADLTLSPQHRVLINSKIARNLSGANEVLVAVKQLLLIDGVEQLQKFQDVEYFHMMFDHHEVVVSNGLASESLFTGPIALASVSNEAREEMLSLFPNLLDDNYIPSPARVMLSGRQARRLTVRHIQKSRALVVSD